MQKTFNVSPPSGMPGMPFDNAQRDVRSFAAKVDIPFGVLCEFTTLADGVTRAIQPVNDAGTAGSFLPRLAGVSMYSAEREQAYQAAAGGGSGYWRAGEMVPVMRKGRIWVQFDGSGTWPDYNTVNVWHSSDGSAAQGVFTMHATQTTLHSEIDNVNPTFVLGCEAGLAFTGYTDGFGNTLSAAVVELDLV